MSFLFGGRRGPKDVPIEQCAPARLSTTAADDTPLYDVLIIGAGSVLANRLSQDPKRSVLLLERGTYMVDFISKIPLLSATRAFQEAYTTAIKSEPQPGFGGRSSVLQIGRMVGGSSAINATVFSRGAHCELDAWNLDGWKGADLDKYFIKSETLFVDRAAGQSTPPLSRGTSGPWKTRITKGVFQYNEPFLQACDAIGITRTPDPHAYEDGKGPDRCTPDGSRHHAGFAYLPEEVLRNRSNLKLCVDAGVEKVEFVKQEDGILKAEGVLISHKGKAYRARAKHIIITSGAIFSPAILQRSGLGPAKLLKSLHIPVLADMPGVGTNLTDHFLVPLHFSGPLQDSAYQMLRARTALPMLVRHALTYWRSGRGLFARACAMESMSYFSSSDVEIVPSDHSPSSTAKAPGRSVRLRCNDLHRDVPDIELTIAGVWADDTLPEYHGLGSRGVVCFLVLLVKPESSGTVEITSDKEADLPRVNPNFLQEGTSDLHALRIGIRVAMTVAAHMRHILGYDIGPACVPGWDPIKGGWDAECLPTLDVSHVAATAPHKKLTTGFDLVDAAKVPDSAIDAFVRKHAFGAQHMASTCAMAPASKPNAVVNPVTLEVHGTRGLSVCDGSIFPRVLSVHPSASIIAAAEKYADELLQTGSV
ncbi:hypothetical protein V8E36_003843 [Tilletia maclaganii]